MVPDDLPYSKGQIDRAGKALRRNLVGEGPSLPDAELEAHIGVMEAFRAVHRTPLLTARMGLRSCIDSEGVQAARLSQRLKRTPTIIDKLRRLPTMTLSRMQDIGGCRAVFATQDEVALVLNRFTRNSERRNGTPDTVRDYVTNPRASGYRAVHIWTRYGDRRIEVQLRTWYQNNWADLVEDITFDTGIDYKDGAGSDIVHQWLRRLAGAHAAIGSGMLAGEVLGPDYDELREATKARILAETMQEAERHA